MKIGIFDSGLGGLIVTHSLIKALPEYDYIYLGDTARVPYGNRSQQMIYEFTRQGVEYLFEQGLVKSIGVANFMAPMLLDLLSYAKIKPTINQIELHPYLTQDNLVAFCRSQNIAVTAYSPFGSTKAPLLADQTVKEIAEHLGKTPAQILIRWAIQRGTGVIPRSSKTARIKENFEVAFELSEEHMETLGKLNRDKHFVDPIEWWGFPYF